MHESPFHWGNAAEGIRGLVESSWKRDKGKPRRREADEKSWEEGMNSLRF